MTRSRQNHGLYDPRGGDRPLRLERFEIGPGPYEPARTNCFSVYRVEAGCGAFWAGTARHSFAADSLLFVVPYQCVRFEPDGPARGDVIRFHANFLCVETFHAEVGCSGALFNDPYGAPAVALDGATKAHVAGLIDHMRREEVERGLAHEDVLLACLKVLLILAARLKTPACPSGGADPRHPVLGRLRELIEEHYCALHAPSDYAVLLHMTPKTLGRVVREHLGRTLTDLIRDRILIHAKWQLLHTLKPVKEVAREVGFADELYFSRLFKKATGCSPTFFREFETEIRGGSNLSMTSAHAPIQPRRGGSDNPDIETRGPGRAGIR